MTTNFDQIVDRSGTGAIKYVRRKALFGREDVMPLWVADMEFRSPEPVIEALHQRSNHGVFGYTLPGDEYFDAIKDWQESHHNWKIDREWLSFVPGVVPTIGLALEIFSEPDDNILVHAPVYTPFFDVPHNLDRKVVFSNLKLEDGKYRMDPDDLRAKMKENIKVFILSNPHNPGGRVWSEYELKELASIAAENNALVISDEIHADLVLNDYRHVPFATVSDEAAMNSITLISPTKTFNIAGLSAATAIVPNSEIREKLNHRMHALHLFRGNIMAYEAARAAYTNGESWRKELISYLEENHRIVHAFFKENLPEIIPMEAEASFLVWLNFSQTGLPPEEVRERLICEAGLGLSPGKAFGPGGEYFQRMNIGIPRQLLLHALEKIKHAFTSLEVK